MSGWGYSWSAWYVIEIESRKESSLVRSFITFTPVGRNMIYVKCLHISGSVFHAIWLVGSSINRTSLFLSFFTAFRIWLGKLDRNLIREREFTFLFSRKQWQFQAILSHHSHLLSKWSKLHLKTFTSWRPLTISKPGKVSIW